MTLLTAGPDTPRVDAVDVVGRILDAVAVCDFEGIMACLARDIVVEPAVVLLTGRPTGCFGRDSVAAWYRQLRADSVVVRAVPLRLVAAGRNRVVAFLRLSVEYPQGGAGHFGWLVFEVAAGGVTRISGHTSEAAAVAAAGQR